MGSEELHIELELDPDETAPRRARAEVGRLATRLPGDVGFRARLAVSELVANSVTHRRSDREEPIRVAAVRVGGLVRVEVRDGGVPFDSAARLVPERATSGRGLRLVDALVDRWGTEPKDGNLVWFEIDQPSGGSPDALPSPRAGRAAGQLQHMDGEADERVQAAAILGRAAEVIREGWCQTVDARDQEGDPVEPWSEQAEAWSLLGGLVAALDGPDAVPAVSLPGLAAAMAALAELIEERSLQHWNDTPGRSQQQVVATLEQARMLILAGVTAN